MILFFYTFLTDRQHSTFRLFSFFLSFCFRSFVVAFHFESNQIKTHVAGSISLVGACFQLGRFSRQQLYNASRQPYFYLMSGESIWSYFSFFEVRNGDGHTSDWTQSKVQNKFSRFDLYSDTWGTYVNMLLRFSYVRLTLGSSCTH